MNPNDAVLAYKNDTVENAPPLKLVRMLYQAAMRHIDRAAASDPRAPNSPFIDALCQADAIVSELRLALATDQAPEITDNLAQLYLFVEDCLQTSMRKRSTDGLADARRVLATLLEAWTKIEVEARNAAPEAGGH